MMEGEKPTTIPTLKAMLMREGEENPVRCIHAHEQAIEQIQEKRGAVAEAIIEGLIKSCPHFGHRGCAHGLHFGAGVYEEEIKMLVREGYLMRHDYYALRNRNSEAQKAVYRDDMAVREFAQETGGDPVRFFEKRLEWERRQMETWNAHIKPLRERLLEVIDGPKVSSEEQEQALLAMQSDIYL